MSVDLPLSVQLSKLLVAFTIEFDNEFEQRMVHRTTLANDVDKARGPWLTSMAMWSNFMRYLPADGMALREVEPLAALTNLGGLQRWRYVDVEPGPADGRQDRIVRPTPAGRLAQRFWQPLGAVIEERWRDRFGAAAVDELRDALTGVPAGGPRFLPIVAYANGMRTVIPDAPLSDEVTDELPVALSRVLLAFTLDFERVSRLSLPMCADIVRLLDDDGVRVRDLPLLSGVSKEGISAGLGFLGRHGCVEVETVARTKVVRPTALGRTARDGYPRLLTAVEQEWRRRLGPTVVHRLRGALGGLLDRPEALAEGLRPYPDGWRAKRPYLTQTEAVLRDPVGCLPQHPMVLHRGGYPDGS